MKLNIIPAIIALLASVVAAFLFYLLSNAELDMLKALAISAFVTIGICLECGIGLSPKDSQYSISNFAVSMLFTLAFIIEHCCFAIWGTSRAWLAITSGLILLVYLLVYHGINKAKM